MAYKIHVQRFILRLRKPHSLLKSTLSNLTYCFEWCFASQKRGILCLLLWIANNFYLREDRFNGSALED